MVAIRGNREIINFFFQGGTFQVPSSLSLEEASKFTSREQQNITEFYDRTPRNSDMDPRLENTIVKWFYTILMVARAKGEQAASRFVQEMLMPDIEMYLDREEPRTKARKRRASEIEPSFMERPTKRRKIERRFWAIHSSCVQHVASQLFLMNVPFEIIMRQCKNLSKGLREIMRWEEEIFPNPLRRGDGT